ncbi:MAG TPA: hypothetical protein VNO30_07720 [Kofleriaceae bacterium]|nr:hypothetical protein [Kofleriaceae bacterium]
MDANETFAPSISEPLTWSEIRKRYPDQQVCLVEIDRIHPRGLAFRTARVAGHGKTRREAFDQMRSWEGRYDDVGRYFTGRANGWLMRPSPILDDEA